MIFIMGVIMLILNRVNIGVKAIVVGLFLGLMTIGCSDVAGPGQNRIPLSEVLASARVNVNSVMMQVGDSVQLSAYGLAIDGTNMDLSEADSVVWSSTNSDNLAVDSTGLIKGLKVSGLPVDIRVRVVYKEITKTHTIPVYVTSNKLDVTDIRLTSLDSSRVGTGTQQSSETYSMIGSSRIRVDLYNGETLVLEGANIPLLSPVDVRYEGGVFQVRNFNYIGNFTVKIDGNIYGRVIADSLEFEGVYATWLSASQFGWDASIHSDGDGGLTLNIDSTWTVGATHKTDFYFVQPCGLVQFSGYDNNPFIPIFFPEVVFSVPPIDIVFSDSAEVASCGASNITDPSATEVIGGNVYNWSPMGKTIYRKASESGEVSWYLRDAVTKEPLGISGKYIIRDPD